MYPYKYDMLNVGEAFYNWLKTNNQVFLRDLVAFGFSG